ncbi:dTMP kinase [Arthrobacter sp. AQ5-05]|uniref:dTMP kinase n=1 Tax=Arthrobacter sp. AQ5-05 TaxID=2184581 RepID=UPI002570BCE5|nr:dTMP kinase [Arthrobacter sp. AQ5-05]
MPSFRTATSFAFADRPELREADSLSGDSSRRRTVVLLGIDGAGKTTTATALVASLRNSGARAQLLRNPAGRRWMTRVAARFGTALTPAWANRLESVVRCVNVLLAHTRAVGFHGTTVMDRHVACQLVLRSVRGLPQGVVLPWMLARLPRPDAIVLIDVPADVAYSRILLRGEDSETLAYLSSSREAYRKIALARGWHIVDGSGTPRQVADDAMQAVRRTS